MAWRLRLVPVKTNIDFFALQWVTFGASIVAVIGSLLAVAIMGLNFGVDFKGGTTIRTESTLAVDVGVYRGALAGLDLGDVAITQVFDPTFREDQHVAMVRIEAQEGEEAITPDTIAAIEGALRAVDRDQACSCGGRNCPRGSASRSSRCNAARRAMQVEPSCLPCRLVSIRCDSVPRGGLQVQLGDGLGWGRTGRESSDGTDG
jgi:hypothetical protein